jgi:ribose transport system ATP-binding protein
VVRQLTSSHLRGLSFEVRAGETLGFAGLVGSGLGELPYALVGAMPASGGQIEAAGRSVPAAKMTPLRATSMGIGLVPGERMAEGLIAKWPVSENMTLPQVKRFQRRAWLRRGQERAFGVRWIGDLGITPAEPDKEVRLLSGGNQQKVLLAKWLGVATSVLIAAEPTAGVDVHAKELIYDELNRQRDAGLPVIVCSTDITDLVKTCNRVIVLSEGRAVGEFHGSDVTEDNILRLALHKEVTGAAEVRPNV